MTKFRVDQLKKKGSGGDDWSQVAEGSAEACVKKLMAAAGLRRAIRYGNDVWETSTESQAGLPETPEAIIKRLMIEAKLKACHLSVDGSFSVANRSGSWRYPGNDPENGPAVWADDPPPENERGFGWVDQEAREAGFVGVALDDRTIIQRIEDLAERVSHYEASVFDRLQNLEGSGGRLVELANRVNELKGMVNRFDDRLQRIEGFHSGFGEWDQMTIQAMAAKVTEARTVAAKVEDLVRGEMVPRLRRLEDLTVMMSMMKVFVAKPAGRGKAPKAPPPPPGPMQLETAWRVLWEARESTSLDDGGLTLGHPIREWEDMFRDNGSGAELQALNAALDGTSVEGDDYSINDPMWVLMDRLNRRHRGEPGHPVFNRTLADRIEFAIGEEDVMVDDEDPIRNWLRNSSGVPAVLQDDIKRALADFELSSAAKMKKLLRLLEGSDRTNRAIEKRLEDWIDDDDHSYVRSDKAGKLLRDHRNDIPDSIKDDIRTAITRAGDRLPGDPSLGEILEKAFNHEG